MASLQEIEQALRAADAAGDADAAKKLAGAYVTMKNSQSTPADPMDGVGGFQAFREGMGKGMYDLARGAGQRLGVLDQTDAAEARAQDGPLMQRTGGKLGAIVGNATAAIPTAFIPGANTVAGASLIGGALGALQPTVEGESVGKNALMSAALGGGAQWGLGKMANAATASLAAKQAAATSMAAQNAGRDSALTASQGAGYAVPPSLANAGTASRILEGLSGKIKTQQAATVGNDAITQGLARRAVGLGANDELSTGALQAIRDKAFQQGYEPVMNAGTMPTSPAYGASLDTIKSNLQGAANSFPGAVKNNVGEMIDSLKVPVFDAGDAIKMTRVLRDQADTAYAQGDKALGRAAKDAAKAIEDEVERNLSAMGKNGAVLLKNFRDARTLMAKTGTVERALVGDGKVNGRVIGSMYQKNKPLTDELKTIGQFAANFPEVAGVPKAGYSNPFTIFDFGFGTATGSPALPFARVAARKAILSGPYQKSLVGPSYNPGLLASKSPAALKELERAGIMGLLGSSVYAAQ